MNNAAFLIDGHLEQKFLRKACPHHPIRRINCNGTNVSISAIADRVASQCRLLNNRHYPIVIVIDREDRTASTDSLCSDLLAQLIEKGVNEQIIIGVVDRMIENWILADAEKVAEHPSYYASVPANTEGLHGKNILKGCIRHYHETTIGVDLLVSCRASVMRSNSTSFSRFYGQLPVNNCWWLNR